MVAKIQLIKQDNFYYILTYLNSKDPTYKTCFPCTDREQEKTLEKAREFGQEIAKSHNTTLEENL